MSGSLPPGWYPAPGSPTAQRWWDGIRWTGEVREADGAGEAEAPAIAFGASPAATGAAVSESRPAESSPAESSLAESRAAESWAAGIAVTGSRGAGSAGTGPAAGQAVPAAPEGAAEGRAAWRAPAVEAWEARTAPESPRRIARWLGKARHQ
jgi:hypothetical protein